MTKKQIELLARLMVEGTNEDLQRHRCQLFWKYGEDFFNYEDRAYELIGVKELWKTTTFQRD